LELAAIFLSLAVALGALLLGPGRRGRTVLVVAVVAVIATSVAARLWPEPAPPGDVLPLQVRSDGYVSSDACRSCHPAEYDSWYGSYHRTMTQIASPEAVKGDFDGVTLASRGRSYHLERVGDEFWVDMVDPDWEIDYMRDNLDPRRISEAPRRRKRIVATTGSHHQQTYWVELIEDRGLFQFPWTYVFDDQIWIPREDAFLQPPNDDRTPVVWNLQCIKCHSTRGKPRLGAANMMFSEVTEFGISCEACHGPGEAHVLANRDPRRRYRLHLSDEPDPTIILPIGLDPPTDSMICGQCHSFNERRDIESWRERGDLYRPGEDLGISRWIAEFGGEEASRYGKLMSQFWPDGTYRVGGREYNGLIASGCYENGDMSCMSCHSMHDSDPDDQLKDGMDGDEACLQCHEGLRAPQLAQQHSHHEAGSSGSACMNCHMPYSVYALFKSIRSHRVDSPTADMSTRYGRPNSCNLCHLDRTVDWSQRLLAEWYGQPGGTATLEEKTIAGSVHLLLTGDAAQRVFAVTAMGWEPAQIASGTDWMAPYLAQMLEDPYTAIRRVAHKSLRTLPGYADFEYDFLTDEAGRADAHRRALARWQGSRADQPAVLIDPDRGLDRDAFTRLLARRNERPIAINE